MDAHLRNRAGGGSHAQGNARALERGPRRRGSAQHPFGISDEDFPVGSQINERLQIAALVQPRRQDPGQNIAADESSDARQESHDRVAAQPPAQIRGAKGLQPVILGFERVMRERLKIDAAKEMVHHRVAHEDDIPQVRLILANAFEEVFDQFANLFSRQPRQLGLALPRDRELDAAHDVRAVTGLRVQGRPDAEHAPAAQIEQLGNEGRGAQIDGDAQPGLRRKIKPRIIGQDRNLPLGDFKGRIRFGPGLARQAPAGIDLRSRQRSRFDFRNRRWRSEHADSTSFAAAAPAAGELDAVSEEMIVQRRAAFDHELLAERQQLDPYAIRHKSGG